MTTEKFLFIGSNPKLAYQHPGGQITASLGLVDYCETHHIHLDIIDSTQNNFPLPSIARRIGRVIKRQLLLIKYLVFNRYKGVIIFCADGLSYYEKTLSALICRCFLTQSMLFVRSGYFISDTTDSKLARALNRYLLKIPNWIGAQGTNWINFYRELGINNDKVVLVRNWMRPGKRITNTPKSIPTNGSETLTFLFLGWLVERKGVNELIDAVRMSTKLRNCRIIVAGHGDLFEHLAATKKRENLERLELPGWQTPEQVHNLLQEAHVFVLPTYAEGFPNALLEAICNGLPVITTPVGAISDSAQNGRNAILVQPGNADELREAMERFVNNTKLITQYSVNSIDIAGENHQREENCSKLFACFSHAP